MPEERVVEAEVVDPAARRPFFEPASGALILGVDWAAFGWDLTSGLFGLPFTSTAAFLVAFAGVAWIQRRRGDSKAKAVFKAFLGGLAAGVPFPVTGTIVGAAILALSRRRG